MASGACPETSSQPPGAQAGAGRTLRLQPGQGQLVWLDASSELRCLSGTAILNSASTHHPGASTPTRLLPYMAWRSAQGAWVGVQAGMSSPATLLLTLAEMPQPSSVHETSRPGHQALQRLRDGLRRLFTKSAHSAG
jgi:hypothetical protein